jgi:hypothetical protein
VHQPKETNVWVRRRRGHYRYIMENKDLELEFLTLNFEILKPFL